MTTPTPIEEVKMDVFDRSFDVILLSIEDNSTIGNPNRLVKFRINSDVYEYYYSGGHTMALGSVVKINNETNEKEIVYSPFKYIPNGSYYEEIGRRLSLTQHDNTCKKFKR